MVRAGVCVWGDGVGWCVCVGGWCGVVVCDIVCDDDGVC